MLETVSSHLKWNSFVLDLPGKRFSSKNFKASGVKSSPREVTLFGFKLLVDLRNWKFQYSCKHHQYLYPYNVVMI